MAVSEKLRIRLNLVAFLVLSIGLVYAMATQVLSILQDRYSVNAFFPDAGGVFSNQEVTYRGITVGQVGALQIVPQGVKIELRIDEGVDIPAEGVEARVMFKSAVGEQFVDILPQSEGEPYLGDGDEIPMERTSIPVSTQSLLSTLESVLEGVPPHALRGAVNKLGVGLTGRGPDIAQIIESTAELAELFARRSPEIEGILRSGTEVGEAFLASKEDFKEAIEQLVTVSDSLADTTPDLERLLRGGSEVSDEIVTLIRENRPALHRFLIRFAELNELQANHADDLSEILSKLPTALAKVNSAFEPETGLVRFGTIQEPNSTACSYATERRPVQDRGPRRPPKNARCGDITRQQHSGDDTASSPARSTLGTGWASPADAGRDPVLPARMAGWSWSLFYLNGL